MFALDRAVLPHVATGTQLLGEAGPSHRSIHAYLSLETRAQGGPPIIPQITTIGSNPGDPLRRGRTGRHQWAHAREHRRGHECMEPPCPGPDPSARHPGAPKGDEDVP